MAKRRYRRHRRRGLRGVTAYGTGLAGLGSLSDPRSVSGNLIPAATGVLVPAATTFAIAKFMPATPGWQQTTRDYAPAIGFGVGLLNALLMYSLGGGPQAITASVTSAFTSAILFAQRQETWGLRGAYSHLGAIVPEYSSPLGALRLEESGSRGGVELDLGGVNAEAFGQSTYSV